MRPALCHLAAVVLPGQPHPDRGSVSAGHPDGAADRAGAGAGRLLRHRDHLADRRRAGQGGHRRGAQPRRGAGRHRQRQAQRGAQRDLCLRGCGPLYDPDGAGAGRGGRRLSGPAALRQRRGVFAVAVRAGTKAGGLHLLQSADAEARPCRAGRRRISGRGHPAGGHVPADRALRDGMFIVQTQHKTAH